MPERNLEEIFPKSPLKEVAFEIRFPVNLSIDGEIYKYQEKIKKELPIFREGEVLGTRMIFREFEKKDEIKLRVLRYLLTFFKLRLSIHTLFHHREYSFPESSLCQSRSSRYPCS